MIFFLRDCVKYGKLLSAYELVNHELVNHDSGQQCQTI